MSPGCVPGAGCWEIDPGGAARAAADAATTAIKTSDTSSLMDPPMFWV